jgi:hypothetical protein
MKAQKGILIALLFISWNSFCQIWTKIEAKDGIHYITDNRDNINIPLLGTYLFEGKEPIVQLDKYGVGFYQLHEQPKRAIKWGLECDENGALLYKKGFDNSKYILWYQYTTPNPDDDEDAQWKTVELTIHFNTKKMFIQGERVKDYTEPKSK